MNRERERALTSQNLSNLCFSQFKFASLKIGLAGNVLKPICKCGTCIINKKKSEERSQGGIQENRTTIENKAEMEIGQ